MLSLVSLVSYQCHIALYSKDYSMSIILSDLLTRSSLLSLIDSLESSWNFPKLMNHSLDGSVNPSSVMDELPCWPLWDSLRPTLSVSQVICTLSPPFPIPLMHTMHFWRLDPCTNYCCGLDSLMLSLPPQPFKPWEKENVNLVVRAIWYIILRVTYCVCVIVSFQRWIHSFFRFSVFPCNR